MAPRPIPPSSPARRPRRNAGASARKSQSRTHIFPLFATVSRNNDIYREYVPPLPRMTWPTGVFATHFARQIDKRA